MTDTVTEVMVILDNILWLVSSSNLKARTPRCIPFLFEGQWSLPLISEELGPSRIVRDLRRTGFLFEQMVSTLPLFTDKLDAKAWHVWSIHQEGPQLSQISTLIAIELLRRSDEPNLIITENLS